MANLCYNGKWLSSSFSRLPFCRFRVTFIPVFKKAGLVSTAQQNPVMTLISEIGFLFCLLGNCSHLRRYNLEIYKRRKKIENSLFHSLFHSHVVCFLLSTYLSLFATLSIISLYLSIYSLMAIFLILSFTQYKSRVSVLHKNHFGGRYTLICTSSLLMKSEGWVDYV